MNHLIAVVNVLNRTTFDIRFAAAAPAASIKIGQYYRFHDQTHISVYSKKIYADEVDQKKLEEDLSRFLGLGKKLL